MQIPDGIETDIRGNISGIIFDEGYYTFGAICSDQNGYSLNYFFTINIQPISYIRTV